MGRTLFVNPTPRQEAEYAALRAAHAAAIAALVEGAPLSAAHAAAVAALDERGQGALVEALGKNVGTGIGLDLRDGSCALTATAAGQVRAGTTFQVAVGELWRWLWEGEVEGGGKMQRGSWAGMFDMQNSSERRAPGVLMRVF